MAEGRIVVTVDSFLAELIPGFLENRRKELPEINRMLEAGDATGLRRLGHNLKGCGSSYGFDGISEIGAAMEKAAIAEKLDEVRALQGRLSEYLAAVEVKYA